MGRMSTNPFLVQRQISGLLRSLSRDEKEFVASMIIQLCYDAKKYPIYALKNKYNFGGK